MKCNLSQDILYYVILYYVMVYYVNYILCYVILYIMLIIYYVMLYYILCYILLDPLSSNCNDKYNFQMVLSSNISTVFQMDVMVYNYNLPKFGLLQNLEHDYGILNYVEEEPNYSSIPTGFISSFIQ